MTQSSDPVRSRRRASRRTRRKPKMDGEARLADRRYAFVGGCPRSGASEVALLLNEHPHVALGIERFSRVRGTLDPGHFEPEVLCNPAPAETDVMAPSFYEHLSQKLKTGQVSVVGDRVPLYTGALDHLKSAFPDCRVVLTVRELEDTAAAFYAHATQIGRVHSDSPYTVSSSWHAALHAARQFENAGHGDQLLVVPFDELLGGQRLWLEMLVDFLGLPWSTGMLDAYDAMVQSARSDVGSAASELPPETRDTVLSLRDADLDSWWHERIERQSADFRGGLRERTESSDGDLRSIPIPDEVRAELLDALDDADRLQPQPLSHFGERRTSRDSEDAELKRRLLLREQELDSTIKQLAAIDASTEVVRSENRELHALHLDLLTRLYTLSRHNEGLLEALSTRDQVEGALRTEINELEREAERRRARVRTVNAELSARIRALESALKERTMAVERLERERDETIEEVRRAASSRAWRWGHAVTLMLRTVTFRRSIKEAGAFDLLMQRLEVPALPPSTDGPADADSRTASR